jgi:hypothetical protein
MLQVRMFTIATRHGIISSLLVKDYSHYTRIICGYLIHGNILNGPATQNLCRKHPGMISYILHIHRFRKLPNT